MMADQQRDLLRRNIWSELESSIEARIERYLSVNHQRLIPDHHFSYPSYECLLLYRDGYFISCNMVAQALSDGILNFVAKRNNLQQAENESKQEFARRMQKAGIFSETFVEAFVRIQASFRNDFHHMNPPVAKVDLEALAKRNITDLASIEQEIFEYSIGSPGTLVPHNPKYWDLQPDGTVPAYVRGF